MWRPAQESEDLPGGLDEAIRRGFVAPPQAEVERRHLVAIVAAVEEAKRAPAAPSPVSRRRALARLALVTGAVVLAVPIMVAGLAFAGVSLPEPVDSAFESVGIELPNQASNGPDRDGGAEAGEPKDEQGEGAARAGDQEGSGRSGAAGADDGASGRGREGGRSGTAPNDQSQGNGPPEHAADGSTGVPEHSQQGGGGPPPHADGSTSPPPQAQGDATGQSSVPAPSPGSGQAKSAPQGAPPVTRPLKPGQGLPGTAGLP